MNWLRFSFLLAFTLLAVFCQTVWETPRVWLGAQFDWLPSLVVYSGATGELAAMIGCAVIGGICQDSFSSNPLGVSVLPLLVIGWLVHRSRELILVDDLLVRVILGGLASAGAFGLGLLMNLVVRLTPLIDWITLWQALVVAAGGAVATPLWFGLIRRMEKVFGYSVISIPSFRSDREIKRGRF
jgi:rod shape-determining protein MreD